MALTISVPRSEVADGHNKERSYVKYCVECHDESGKLIASTWHRFREFHALSNQSKAAGLPPMSLPPRFNVGPVDTEKRRLRLEKALQTYLASRQDSKQLLLQWLNVDAHVADGRVNQVERPSVVSLPSVAEDTDMATAVTPAVSGCWWLSCGVGVAMLAVSFAALRNKVESDMLIFLLGVMAGSCITATMLMYLLIRSASRAPDSASPPPHAAVVTDAAVASNDSSANPAQDALSDIAPSAPPALLSSMHDTWFETLLLNVRDDQNFQGHPWKHVSSAKGADIYSGEITGLSRRVWKSVHTMKLRVDRETVKEHTFTWENRLAWDMSFKSGERLAAFDDGSDISRYASKAQAGIVSSREFIDGRQVRDRPDGGFIIVSASVTAEQFSVALVPAPVKDMVRADCQSGSGMLAIPLPAAADAMPGETHWKIIMVGCIDLKGWIPVKFLNLAMSNAMTGTCTGMRRYFEAL